MKLRLGFLILLVSAAGAHAEIAAAPLSFRAALDEIMRRSTGVATQQAGLEATRARNVPVRLTYLPALSANAKKSFQSSSGFGGGGTQAEVVASMNLFRFGGDVAANRAATQDEANQIANVDDSKLVVEEAGVDALIARIERMQEVQVDRSIVAMQSKSETIARERYRRGYLPLQEAEKITVDLQNASSRLADAQLAEIQAQATLESLLGPATVEPLWPWKDVFSDAAQVKALSADDLKLSDRPDWRAARARTDAEDARVSQATAAILPSFDGSFAYGYYSGFLGYGIGYPGITQWTGTLSVTLPLFDHLTNYSNARAQRFVRTSAEINLEQVERQARSDWDAARGSFQTAVASALARERTLELSRRLFEDNQRRFQAGRIDANELQLDQSRLFDSEIFSLQGWSAAHLAYSRLCHARGRSVWNCGS